MNNQALSDDITKRTALLDKLHQITFAAFLTVLCSESALELTTFTSEGISYQWIGYDDWNVYKLAPCHPEKWQEIISAITTNTLSSSHLTGTCFERLIDSTIGQDTAANYSSLLSGLLEIPTAPTDAFYCYYDSDEQTFIFATNQDDLKSILANTFVADTPQSDIATDDLEFWLDRYEDEGHKIPCYFFGHQQSN